MDVLIPRETVSDDSCQLLAIYAQSGETVECGSPIFEFESSKSVFDVVAEFTGRLEWSHLEIGRFYPVGQAVAQIVETEEAEPKLERPPLPGGLERDRILSNDAKPLVQDNSSIPAERQFIRRQDITPPVLSNEPDPAAQLSLDAELSRRRHNMQSDFQRHVPTGTLLNDRWALAQSLGFGNGSSVYDDCLIMGDVEVGHSCWIGPFCVLDGAHAKLSIGDSTSIAAGVQVYTHDSIARYLTGNPNLRNVRPVQIGSNCFIGPGATVGPGTTLGNHCLVAAGCYVEGSFPPYSFIAGNPAKRVGLVTIVDDEVQIKRLEDGDPPK